MSLENVKAQAVASRSEKDIVKKLDLLACAIEELANALAQVRGVTAHNQQTRW